jgi:hypothetical protein
MKRPIRTSGSRRSVTDGVSTGSGGRSGAFAGGRPRSEGLTTGAGTLGGRADRLDTQLTLINTSANQSRRRAARSAAVVAKFELDPEVLSLEEGYDRLQLVSRRRGDSDLLALNAGLNLLESLVLDGFDHPLGHILRNALRQRERSPDALTGRHFEIAELQVFHWNSALDHLGLEHVNQGIHPEFVIGAQTDLAFGPIEIDGAVGAFEVVPLRDLFVGLVHGVIDLLQIGAGRYVE